MILFLEEAVYICQTRAWELKKHFEIIILYLLAEKFRFSAEFIEMRRQALDVFINRIASHHELRQSDDLRTFLQADEQVIILICLFGLFSGVHVSA